MIHKLDRVGTEEENDGTFLINDSVQVKYVNDGDDITMEINYDDDVITEKEAQELAEELFQNTINMFKEI